MMKKRNRKAFTLVEMLAVIGLIALLSLVTVNVLINQFNKLKKDLNEKQIDLIYSAAKSYVNDNVDDYPKVMGKYYCVTLNSLINKGYLSDNLVDAINDSKLDKNFSVKVIVDSEISYKYEFSTEKDICIIPQD